MRLADSHCHLDDHQFDADREAAIERAQAAGVEYFLTIGTGDGPPDLAAAVRLAEQYPFIYATVGVHPNDTPKLAPDTFAELERLLRHPKVKALGEIGLDYHWGVPKEPQYAAFVRQLEIAAAACMPVIIHTREAWADTLDLLRRHWAPSGLPAVMHCFTGTVDEARQCLDMDCYLAFGGVTTFPKATAVREAAAIVPPDRLLLETDAPYLAPIPFRGKRNEPAYISHTASEVAKARGVSQDTLADLATTNFKRLFQVHGLH